MKALGCSALLRVGFDEVDVGFDLRHTVIPIGLVLDGDVTVKFLTLQFFQAGGDIDHAFTGDHDRCSSVGGLVLEMNTHNATIEDTEAFNRLEM